MNKNIKLAVAGAVLALSASAANAGIIIPAGDWTVDINGNMNAFYTNKSVDYKWSHNHGSDTVYSDSDKSATANTIGTGLLPSSLGIGAKTRQNDLDVAFQFSFWTGTSSGSNGGSNLGGGNNSLNIRQAYLTFGDKSWGQIKLGRDLGVFGSDAILSDMTLLGVGVSGTGWGQPAAGGNSTLGRIGSGYLYANWYGQVQYQSPVFNGFQVTAAIQENAHGESDSDSDGYNHNLGFAGKATYDFAANDVTGRVWVGGFTQKNNEYGDEKYRASVGEIGAKVSASGFGLVGYYYDGKGVDSQFGATNQFSSGDGNAPGYNDSGVGGILMGNDFRSDDSGGYVQATYTIPGVGTKLGASWGQSNSKGHESYRNGRQEIENESWIVGAYHPLTKHLNLVAEYTNQKIKSDYTYDNSNASARNGWHGKAEADTVSLGAILFF